MHSIAPEQFRLWYWIGEGISCYFIVILIYLFIYLFILFTFVLLNYIALARTVENKPVLRVSTGDIRANAEYLRDLEQAFEQLRALSPNAQLCAMTVDATAIRCHGALSRESATTAALEHVRRAAGAFKMYSHVGCLIYA
jgi:hypothetical protein